MIALPINTAIYSYPPGAASRLMDMEITYKKIIFIVKHLQK